MEGIETRLDALYFSATTMTTTGYGDIVATGQLARGLVTAQLVFDVVFVATVVGLIQAGIRRRQEASRPGSRHRACHATSRSARRHGSPWKLSAV